jgi:serine/threonine protein phosphatase PrpC
MYYQSGTTGVCILQIDQELFIMNVGDSRAIMCNVEGGEISAMEISNDHKPFHPVEKERIERMGGEIMPKEGTTGPLRVWKRDEESPGLAVTRTLGDLLGHSIGVSAEPDIEYWKVMSDDYFIIIASDGVWDVMNSAEVVGYLIKETDDMKKGVIQLVQTARSIWEYQNFLRN